MSEKYDLIADSLRCVIRGANTYRRMNQEMMDYCTHFYPTSQKESYRCPFLEDILVEVVKGRDVGSYKIYRWGCSFSNYDYATVSIIQEFIRDDLDDELREVMYGR